MEENQNDLLGQESISALDEQENAKLSSEQENEQLLDEQEAIEEEVAAAEVAPCEEQAPAQPQESSEEDAQDAQEPTSSLAWDFAGDARSVKNEKKGKVAFFAIFSSVLLICLALLVALLFVGENGIRIFRTLHTERVVYVREDNGTSGLLTPQEAADIISKSTVTVSVRTQSGTGNGSGFVYDENGHICTNYHVIDGAVSVQVILPDGNAYDAEIVGYNEPADLAVLRVQASGLVPVKLGSSADLLVGDEVVAVGTPASMLFAGTATFGRVSATRRLLPVDDDGDGTYEKKIVVIQTDTSVNPGNSGGPMADMYGRVVGIVVRKIINYNGSNYEGVGFAIPIDGAKTIVDAIIQNGSFTGDNPVVEGRSLLGVTGHPGVKGQWYYVDPLTNKVLSSDIEVDGYHYMPVDGVYVIEAQGAGVKNKIYEGDVILAVNGFTVYSTQELITVVNCYACGETVCVSVWRGDATVEVQVVLGEG